MASTRRELFREGAVLPVNLAAGVQAVREIRRQGFGEIAADGGVGRADGFRAGELVVEDGERQPVARKEDEAGAVGGDGDGGDIGRGWQIRASRRAATARGRRRRSAGRGPVGDDGVERWCGSRATAPLAASTSASLAFDLPMSMTATAARAIGVTSIWKTVTSGDGDRLVVRLHRHDVGHVRPPAFHHRVVGQVVHRVVVGPPEDAEQRVGLAVEMDGIVGDAGVAAGARTSSGQISSWRRRYSASMPGLSCILKAYFCISRSSSGARRFAADDRAAR